MDTGYLTTQVATIIGQLHALFDEIGVPKQDRESRESEVSLYIIPKVTLLTLTKAFHGSFGDITQPFTSSHSVSLLCICRAG